MMKNPVLYSIPLSLSPILSLLAFTEGGRKYRRKTQHPIVYGHYWKIMSTFCKEKSLCFAFPENRNHSFFFWNLWFQEAIEFPESNQKSNQAIIFIDHMCMYVWWCLSSPNDVELLYVMMNCAHIQRKSLPEKVHPIFLKVIS